MAGPVIVCPSCDTKNRLPLAARGTPRCATCKTPLPWLVDADDADFDAIVDTSALVVVDLWAPWCGPCRLIAPVLESLSREFAGKLKVVKVNVDTAPGLSQRFQARSIPMLLVMDQGEVIDTLIGAQPAPILRGRITGALDRRS